MRAQRGAGGTHKDTSCFQTGFTAEMREPKSPLRPDLGTPPFAEVGEPDWLPLPSLLEFALVTAVSAEMAVEDDWRERLVAMPFASFSVSSMGSRPTNSFCSNCTTT